MTYKVSSGSVDLWSSAAAVGLTRLISVCVCVSVCPTVLCAGSQKINDVLVLADDLHHLHLRDQVRQVFFCGVGWRKRKRKRSQSVSYQSADPLARSSITTCC